MANRLRPNDTAGGSQEGMNQIPDELKSKAELAQVLAMHFQAGPRIRGDDESSKISKKATLARLLAAHYYGFKRAQKTDIT